jgi:hypothetical protein
MLAFTALVLIAGLSPSAAEVPGVNGNLSFGRLGSMAYAVNPRRVTAERGSP